MRKLVDLWIPLPGTMKTDGASAPSLLSCAEDDMRRRDAAKLRVDIVRRMKTVFPGLPY
jgi:hypothetical protein